MSWPWSQLGLPGPSGLSEVRHAYAEKLKITHPEEDPEGFQRLHSAYQLASRMARQQKRQAGVQTPEPREERPPQPEPEQVQDLALDELPERDETLPHTQRGLEEGQDVDFDELLERDETPPHAQRGLEEEQDFDFDELLERDETLPHVRRGPEKERDFNFDELLERDETPPRPEEEERDWDYDRLFAEGEAERAEARRRRGVERRGKRSQEIQERLRFRQEEERWQGTEAILHTIELLHSAQAEGEQWQKFFASPLFQQNKESIDLIFGLEDFVSTKRLSQEARLALFLAYGFDKGVSRPELRPLFQMLLPAWRTKKARKREEWIRNLLAIPVTFGLIYLGAVVLTSPLFVVFVVLGMVILHGLNRGWLNRKPKNLGGKKRGNPYAIMFAAGAALAAAFLLPGLVESVQDVISARDPRERVCQYVEKDFGVEVGSMYNRSSYYAIDSYDNVFYLKSDLEKVFLVGPDGERDRKNGKPGYTTNLPEMMMLWAVKDFAKAHSITGVDLLDYGLKQQETNGSFLITLPFYGAGDIITDLGELLEELSQTEWYQVRMPEVELVLCGKEMAEGRLILSRWSPAEGPFDEAEVRALYEEAFAHAYSAQLLKELELDRDFLKESGERYTLTNGGIAQMKGRTCCKLCGLDESGAVAMEYYVDTEQSNIYCVPGDFWERGNREEQISFYRVLHQKGSIGIYNLFYPWLTAAG